MNTQHPNIAQTGTGTFQGLGIAPRLLEALARLKFQQPTPIQHQSIPPAIEGRTLWALPKPAPEKHSLLVSL